MKFSFVTSTYNRDRYIGQALQSTCDQTYPNEDYEIVIVDNNSTDNTAAICNEFISKYPEKQIRYFKEMEQGIAPAQNRAIREARGEYIIFVDDDETIIPEHLERLAEHLKNYPQAELIGTAVIPVYEVEQPKWMSYYTQRLIGGYFDQGKKVKTLSAKNYPGTGHTIIKKELYERYGYYKTELGRKGKSLIGAEDKDMINRLINLGITCYYFPNIPIYHHIPASKMTDDFFHRVTYAIGKSERMRTKSVSEKEFRKRIISEIIKWAASFVLCIGYTVTLRPAKGFRLLQFRWNVSKGLLGK
ncbi:glycosyltransferase family 2 protein [Dysgonomonas macrotermitis]|uniref:Glycosyltransferase, GT2 family n=1 Tax=Dysgonomonas macrotermitis TaxID=1346286 RepID=A0A1M5CB95_9BACT|nr:glycosyltransferase family A protein [Dysgonomonas macrotermitis]SHF51692.1 Glycosyltransferase, GT2 family [Dysgonomonas macrotermitis]